MHVSLILLIVCFCSLFLEKLEALVVLAVLAALVVLAILVASLDPMVTIPAPLGEGQGGVRSIFRTASY